MGRVPGVPPSAAAPPSGNKDTTSYENDPWGLKQDHFAQKAREKVIEVLHISSVYPQHPNVPRNPGTQWRAVVITEYILSDGTATRRKRTISLRGEDEMAVYKKLVIGGA